MRGAVLKILWLLLLALLTQTGFAANPLHGIFSLNDERAGTTVLPFLKLPAGARSLALGGNLGALENGAAVAYWNPAGIAEAESFEASLTHMEILGEFRYENVQSIVQLPVIGNLGLGFSGLFATPFTGARNINEDPASVRAMDWTAGIGWGWRTADERFAAGLRLNYLQSVLDSETGRGYSVDLGGRFALLYDHVLSLGLHNLSHGFSYGRYNETLPALFRLSVGRSLPYDMFGWTGGYVKGNDGSHFLNGGLEWNWKRLFFMRAGYRKFLTDRELEWYEGLSGGVGIQVNALTLDYGYRTLAELGAYHAFSIGFNPWEGSAEAMSWEARARKAYEEGNCVDAVRFARKALRQDPGSFEARMVVQQCRKDELLNRGNYTALFFTGNTSEKVTPVQRSTDALGGLARRKTFFDQMKKSYPFHLFLDAGRLFQNDSSAMLHPWVVRGYAELGYDAVLLGEKEVRSPLWSEQPGLMTVLPWLRSDDENRAMVRELHYTKGGMDVRVLAFAPRAEGADPDLKTAAERIDQLRRAWKVRPDIVVVMLDGDLRTAEELLRYVSGVDIVVLSGETELTPRPVTLGNTIVFSPGRDGAWVSRLIWFEDGQWTFDQVPMGAEIPADIRMAAMFGDLFSQNGIAGNSEPVNRQDYESFIFRRNAGNSGQADVWLFDANAGYNARLTRSPLWLSGAQVAWSQNILMTTGKLTLSQPNRLRLQKLTSKDAVPATAIDSSWDVHDARWGPYENWVYFRATDPDGFTGLYKISASGTHLTDVSGKESGNIVDYTTDATGRFLAYVAKKSGGWGVYHTTLTAGEPIRLPVQDKQIRNLQYSPSGNSLAFLQASISAEPGDAVWQLAVWNRYTDSVQLFLPGKNLSAFAWQSDSKMIIQYGQTAGNLAWFDLENRTEQVLFSDRDLRRSYSVGSFQLHHLDNQPGVLIDAKAGAQGGDDREIRWIPLGKELRDSRKLVDLPGNIRLK